MRDTSQIELALGAGTIVEQKYRTVALREEVLERKHLPSVAKRVTGQETDFRQGIKNHATRLYTVHLFKDALGRVLKLNVGWVERGILVLRA